MKTEEFFSSVGMSVFPALVRLYQLKVMKLTDPISDAVGV